MSRLWIGGMPGAGKTTVARTLARRHGLRWYNADMHTWDHRDRALREGDVHARQFEELDPVQRWQRPVEQLLDMSLHATRAPMVADDVRDLPPAPLTIAEGTPVAPKITGDDPAVWLMVSPAAQRDRLEQRGLGERQQELYLALGEVITREVTGAAVLYTDNLSIEEVTVAVAARFTRLLETAPKADTATERQELLRYANQAQVNQVRGYFARPWARGNVEAVRKRFACECGSPHCTAEVELPIGEYLPFVLADGHRPPVR